MTKTNELPPPSAAKGAPDATEVFRAWIVGTGLQVSLRQGFDDPGVWGLLLVDVARHAARVYATEGVCSADEAMQKIRAMWNAEIATPTDLGSTKPGA